MFMNQNSHNMPIQPQNMNMGGGFYDKKPNESPQISNEILDMLTQILSKESGEQQPNANNETEKQENEHFWSGFITRNKQHRVGVDATLISGEEISLVEYNLNISLRTFYDEVFKKKSKAVAIFTPSNETQNSIFLDYINYFNEKKRVGVVPIRNFYIYLLPPGEESKKIYPEIKELQILGVFVDINAPNIDQQPGSVDISSNFSLKSLHYF